MHKRNVSLAIILSSTGIVLATDSSVPHIKADLVQAQGIEGFGVTVAVIDDGINPNHPGLAGSIHPQGAYFLGGVQQPGNPGIDIFGEGHGTYMSLIITDATGVAPNAQILPIGVFGPGGGALPRDIIDGIRYAIFQSKADPSIRVINLSLGGGAYDCPCDNDNTVNALFQIAINDALAEGIVTFAATGNDGACGGISSPACVTSATKVTASYDAFYNPTFFDPPADCGDISPDPNWVVCFSNRTTDCDYLLAAPGYDIRLWEGAGLPLEFSGHGTSQATAHASGVAALMFSKVGCGSLSAPTARSLIFNTAQTFEWAFPTCPLSPQPKHVDALAAVNAVAPGVSGVLGDLDCDGTVSLYDLEDLVACMTGPGGGPVQGYCLSGDFPGSPPDGDIDLQDFAGFQLAFTGFGSGACCHTNGTCSVETVDDCVAEFGTRYHGHGTTCAGVTCPLPGLGACCDAIAGTCVETTPDDCGFGGGFYFGDGTSCASTPCPDVRYRNVIDPLTSLVTAGTGLEIADTMELNGIGGGELAYYDLNVFGNGGGSFDLIVGLYTDLPGSGGTLIPGTERTFIDLDDLGSPVFASATFEPPVTIPQQFWMVARFSNASAGWFRADDAEIGFTENFYGRNDPPWNLYWFGGTPWAGLWANVATTEDLGGGAGTSTFGSDSPATTSSFEELDVPPADQWIMQDARLDFELQPLGGGSAVRRLEPNTAYELHYTTKADAVTASILASVAATAAEGLVSVTSPPIGTWSDTGNFLFEAFQQGDLIPDPDQEGLFRTAWTTDTAVFPEESDPPAPSAGHLHTITTGDAGALTLELYMYYVDEGAGVWTNMEAVKTYEVQP